MRDFFCAIIKNPMSSGKKNDKMAKAGTVNSLIMFAVIIIGIILLVSSAQVDSALRNSDITCDTKAVQNCNRGILVISLLLIFSGFAYIYATTSFLGNCNCTTLEVTGLMYAAVFLCLGIVLLVLSGTMKRDLGASGCKAVKEKLQTLNIIGGLLTALGALYLGYEGYGYYLQRKFSEGKGQPSSLKRGLVN